MPPKKAAGSDASTVSGLSENELRFIKAVFDNMTQKPDADWDKVAGDLNLKDAKCAKERFRQMSVRHGWRPNAQAGASGSSPGKGKRDVTGPSGDGKVAKKPRVRTPKKAAAAKKEESWDAEMKKKSEGDDGVKIDMKSEDEEDGVPF
ncbi:hypothetical protein ACQKWADRAFT_63886 [Trichoderma austrokoningii]